MLQIISVFSFHELVCSFKPWFTLIIFGFSILSYSVILISNSQWHQQLMQWSRVTYCVKCRNLIIIVWKTVFHVWATRDLLIVKLSSLILYSFSFIPSSLLLSGKKVWARKRQQMSVLWFYTCECVFEARCNYQKLVVYQLLSSVNCRCKTKSNRIHKMHWEHPIFRQQRKQWNKRKKLFSLWTSARFFFFPSLSLTWFLIRMIRAEWPNSLTLIITKSNKDKTPVNQASLGL